MQIAFDHHSVDRQRFTATPIKTRATDDQLSGDRCKHETYSPHRCKIWVQEHPATDFDTIGKECFMPITIKAAIANQLALYPRT
ncbi:hypothetical protein D3C76_1716510 [compost metagenome]